MKSFCPYGIPPTPNFVFLFPWYLSPWHSPWYSNSLSKTAPQNRSQGRNPSLPVSGWKHLYSQRNDLRPGKRLPSVHKQWRSGRGTTIFLGCVPIQRAKFQKVDLSIIYRPRGWAHTQVQASRMQKVRTTDGWKRKKEVGLGRSGYRVSLLICHWSLGLECSHHAN